MSLHTTLIVCPVADAAGHPQGDVPVWNHSLPGWDHLQVISGTNVISEAAPEI